MRSINGVTTKGRNWVFVTSLMGAWGSRVEIPAIGGQPDALFQLFFGESSSPSGEIFPPISSGIS